MGTDALEVVEEVAGAEHRGGADHGLQPVEVDAERDGAPAAAGGGQVLGARVLDAGEEARPEHRLAQLDRAGVGRRTGSTDGEAVDRDALPQLQLDAVEPARRR